MTLKTWFLGGKGRSPCADCRLWTARGIDRRSIDQVKVTRAEPGTSDVSTCRVRFHPFQVPDRVALSQLSGGTPSQRRGGLEMDAAGMGTRRRPSGSAPPLPTILPVPPAVSVFTTSSAVFTTSSEKKKQRDRASTFPLVMVMDMVAWVGHCLAHACSPPCDHLCSVCYRTRALFRL